MVIYLLNGLVYGGLLYILSVGLVLIFGLRRVVNFAHGGLFMIGGYIAYSATQIGGFWVGLMVAIFALSVLGVVLDRLVLQKLQKEDPVVTMLVTFGLLLVLQDLAQTVWGRDFLTLPAPSLLAGSITLDGASFPLYRLAIIVAGFAVMAALSIWLRFSRIGLYVRASSVDPVTTGMQGVDTERLSAIVVSIGTGLAGLSGVIAAPLLALSPAMGSNILIDCFIVVVTGGLGSFTGAFIAAMLIGQVDTFGVIYLPQISAMIPLLVMVLVLIWRPEGLAGTKES